MRLGTVLIFGGLLGLLTGGPVKADDTSSGLTWRLENSFRFFRRAEDTERLRIAFGDLRTKLNRTPTIREFEQHLAVGSDGWGWSEEILEGSTATNISERLTQEACWYQKGRCSNYTKPRAHRIILQYRGATGICTWFVASKKIGAMDCSERIKASIPYPQGAEVSVAQSGNKLATTVIKVRDIMVVGMGDSFSSGEGNPDVAVRFNDNRVLHYAFDDWNLRGYPPRRGAWKRTNDNGFQREAARWVHTPCHRSLYSQHVRLALHLALSDPAGQTSVTYVGVACTGAEIVQGLFRPWKGNEDPRDKREDVRLAQISGVSQALCAGERVTLTSENSAFQLHYFPEGQRKIKRRVVEEKVWVCSKDKARSIDILLLSIGGNDVGFGRLVSSAAIASDKILETMAAAARKKLKINVKEAAAFAQALPHNYDQVNRALRDVLHIDRTKRVVLTAYPLMSFDENGNTCKDGTRGMDVTRMYRLQSEKAVAAENFVSGQLLPVMKAAAAKHGWIWVDQHREKFRNHGICAVGGRSDDVVANLSNFPRRRNKEQTSLAFLPKRSLRNASKPINAGFRATAANVKWVPYKPSLFRPYLPRQRWFRTPNDAFLAVNLHKSGGGSATLNVTQFSAYSGAFHPTAQGHAVIADAVFQGLYPRPQAVTQKPPLGSKALSSCMFAHAC